MAKYVLICFGVFLLSITSLWAQDRQLTGTLRDEQGQPMPGANVVIKGTSRGTSTDAVGEFRLQIPSGGTTLTISSVGYLSKEVTVGTDQNQLNVVLAADARQLQEVTITTALGIDRNAKTLTYSAQRVEGRQLTDVRDANFTNTLNGKVAGLVVTQGAGGPGSASRVILRGNRSIQGNNSALFVVDGVPIDNSNSGQVTSDFGGFNGSDGASNINPDDIASISVLKGAAGSALYGSRAANGVVMITTKRGKSGKVDVNVNSGVAMESAALLPQFQNDYGQGNGGVASDKSNGSWGVKGATTYPNNVANFFRNAYSTNNSVGITGGSEKIQSYVSYTHNYNQGIVPKNDLTRHTLNLRLNTQISSRLTTDAKITYINQSIDNKVRVGEGGVVLNAYKVPRSVDLADYKNVADEAGNPRYWTTSSVYMNPYWTVDRIANNELRNRVLLLGSARYELTDWLSVQGRASYDRYDDANTYQYADRTLLYAQTGGTYQVANAQNIERNIDILFQGNNGLGGGLKLAYNLGGSVNDRSNIFTQTNANGLLVPNKFDLQFARTLQVFTGLVKRQLESVYGTASLSLNDYLILDVTARNDWSSTLPAPHSYFYPSVGVTAVVSDMTTLPDAISFAKIRASYAQVGNDPDPYRLAQTYSFGQGGTGGFVSRDGTKPIENLKPEITTSLEIGADVRFLNNRLGLDFTFYKTNSRNQLLTLGLAPASGFSDQFINAGNVQNTGFEMSLTAKPLAASSRLQWDLTLNAARNKNLIVALDPNIKQSFLGGSFGRLATPVVREGGSYGDLYAFRWQRDAQNRFVVDANGKPLSSKEAEYIGNFNPNFSLGLNNSFTYGNLSFGFLIDGKFGGVLASGTDANSAFDGTAAYTTANRDGGWILPAVTPTGEANTKAINAETFWTTVSGGRYSWGEFFAYDATNVRVRELTLGYTINTPGTFIKSARLSLVARNLFFLYRGNAILDIPGVDKRKLQYDPDVNLGAGNFQGIENGNLPSTRTLGLNLKLAF
ncbi:SusC/RagA family TonB-linked outer membrane protein [Fibrella sp. HMF5335]|uniref:SusC/RagA family TonB-linked outer membrane protein n=1 Tax=Fibrella rubiginis TaxID=2817060 RepID=A0A939GHP7_9BACT|nr:SusC/RagA family TonB-linked outer membrane protein [Fibrella rubiginis]MBO0936662.1 SusC/RagA family TonB-linked outer membrane protein [Fibrella rubiginis]